MSKAGAAKEEEESAVSLRLLPLQSASLFPATLQDERGNGSLLLALLLTSSALFLLLSCVLVLILLRIPIVLPSVSPSPSLPLSTTTPRSSPLPSTTGCVIPMYSHDDSNLLYELQWSVHYLVASLPSLCSRPCVVRWRPWAAFEADFTSLPDNPSHLFQPQPHIRYPLIWTGWRDDLLTLHRFCASAGREGVDWCRRQVVLFHVGDEGRGGDQRGQWRFDYGYYHTVFRSYHSAAMCDYSYLLHGLLLELGYPAEALDVDLAAAPSNAIDFFSAVAEQRIEAFAAKEGAQGTCPTLATRLLWREAMEAAKEELRGWVAPGQPGLYSDSASLPILSDIPADALQRIHQRVRRVIAESATSASDATCHRSALFAYYQRQQAHLHDRLLPSRPNSSTSSPIYWLPVGHSMNGLAVVLETGVGASSLRPHLWSWFGSIMPEKVERLAMSHSVLAANASVALSAVVHRGLYLETGGFGQGLRGIALTQALADSVFVPLPAGDFPDQFRTHEAMEAGAIPIVSHANVDEVADPYLSWLQHLGLDPVYLERGAGFEGLVESLYWLQFVPAEVLDAWQGVLYQRYMLMMRSMREQVAKRVCMITQS